MVEKPQILSHDFLFLLFAAIAQQSVTLKTV